ncbi:MAG: RNA 2',3'-cyclic phosphodiesterase [Clostridiaceae bacterium]|nr:RNA 2',3'-cyclic phosphodiesterase [Clostridiaceae bacterium]
MRLFIAVNFDEETKARLIKLQQKLKAQGSGNFTHSHNLHLTLAFLGEVSADRGADASAAMDCTAVSPMELIFDHVGSFTRDGGDIWWIGLKENRTFMDMQQRLYTKLKDKGFVLESRRFSPHITLAREYNGRDLDAKGLLEHQFSTSVSAISLMLSERMGGKLIYTELYRR